MDSHSLHQQTLTPTTKSRLSHTLSKVLQIRKPKLTEKLKHNANDHHRHDEKHHNTATDPTMDAFIAKVFASVSSVKAAYARMQVAQSPYDPEGIQLADKDVVVELKRLSELKQTFFKKHVYSDTHNGGPPETALLLAEIQEHNNLVLMYDITLKNLDRQKQLQDSEIVFLKEKLNEAQKENKMIERRLNSNFSCNEKLSFSLSSHEKFNLSSITVNRFLASLEQTKRSVRGFVKMLMGEMDDADWDLEAATSSIQPGFLLRDTSDKCYVFESFVCRVMFDGFNNPNFSIEGFDSCSRSRQSCFDEFTELKSSKAREYIEWKPDSMFAKFCWVKYLKLVHPVMEFSIFGNLNQRNLVSGEKPPETRFFSSFADVARRVWLLHCLASALSNKASVFRVREGSRFTDMYMESVNEEPTKYSPEVGFTVIPGFKVGGTIIQCQVYLT